MKKILVTLIIISIPVCAIIFLLPGINVTHYDPTTPSEPAPVITEKTEVITSSPAKPVTIPVVTTVEIETELQTIELPLPAKPEAVGKTANTAIAVLPFKVLGESFMVGKDAGRIIADAFVSQIDSKKYKVYERLHLKTLLEEKGFQESLLVNNPQPAAAFGKLSKVDFVVIGTISKLGGRYSISARLVNCTTGMIQARKHVDFHSITVWSDKVAQLVGLLQLKTGTEASPYPTATQLVSNDLLDALNPSSAFAVKIKTASEKQTYYEGEYIKFSLSAERDCYITLITVDTVGQMSLIFPNKWQKDNFLRAGKQVTIPTTQMGFRFPVKPPHGETVVKAIATLVPLKLTGVDAESIQEQGFQQLDNDVKAISVEPNTTSFAGLNPEQWTTDELLVITAENRIKTAKPTDSISVGRTEQFDLDQVGVNPSDRIRHRYKQLTKNTLIPSQLILNRSQNQSPVVTADEYLVFHKATGNYIKIKPDRLGKYKDSPEHTVVPNIKLYSMSLPSTRLSEVQWHLKNHFAEGVDLGVATDYRRNIQRPATLIGLVDGAVDFKDPRIAHAAWTNPNEIPGNGIDDDSNGYVDDVNGWNFNESSNRLCPNPYQFNHGTSLVSVIASKPTGSDHDVIGIAPQAKIVTAVVLQSADSKPAYNNPIHGDLAGVIDAIKYVANCGAKVINCSFGTYVTPTQLAELNRLPLWEELNNRQVTIVCAAGNDNVDIDANPIFPASLPQKNIIAVAASGPSGKPGTYYDKRKKKWLPFTNYGKATVDKTAPGSLILAGSERSKTRLCDGTSYSAAIVTALKAIEN